jgi:hypothetical protein
MPTNDAILVAEMVERSRDETDGMSAAEQEAYFFAKHYLKSYAPTHDDLLAGIVDGANDGGIDGLYIFVNGLCVRDDVPLRSRGYGADVHLIAFQVKNTTGFSEGAVDKLIIHLPELLAFDRDERALSKRFNRKVIEVTRRFLRVLQDLDMPELSIFIAYASLKAESTPHPNVAAKGTSLEEAVQRCFGTSRPSVAFLDAASVHEVAQFRTPTTKTLVLAENAISTDTEGGSYIGVASLDEYNRFILDGSGRLDAAIFDANVRDYESGSLVNQSIQETLEARDADVDFWWLNNGVTVVADRVQLNGKRLTLASPQVVNGLQTSHEIFKRGTRAPLDDKRSVLVKVIEAGAEATKDRIIKATNSQTTLGTSTLRATDKVQRKIEEYLSTVGLYYERRKNYYRNQQIPLPQLVSIDQMGQAVTATLAQVPHVARGETSKIFEDETYHLVFHESYPLAAYAQAITVLRGCELFLRQDPSTKGEVENFAFHLSMLTVIAMTRKNSPRAEDLAALNKVPSSELLRILLPLVRKAFSEVVNSKNYVLFDQVAKDPLSTTRLLAAAQHYLATSKAS